MPPRPDDGATPRAGDSDHESVGRVSPEGGLRLSSASGPVSPNGSPGRGRNRRRSSPQRSSRRSENAPSPRRVVDAGGGEQDNLHKFPSADSDWQSASSPRSPASSARREVSPRSPRRRSTKGFFSPEEVSSDAPPDGAPSSAGAPSSSSSKLVGSSSKLGSGLGLGESKAAAALKLCCNKMKRLSW